MVLEHLVLNCRGTEYILFDAFKKGHRDWEALTRYHFSREAVQSVAFWRDAVLAHFSVVANECYARTYIFTMDFGSTLLRNVDCSVWLTLPCLQYHTILICTTVQGYVWTPFATQ